LNNIKARLSETSESWVNAIFFVMNLAKLLQVAEKYPGFFVPIFKFVKNWLKIFSMQKLSTKYAILINHACQKISRPYLASPFFYIKKPSTM